jgi:tetratricopeptide (TPR) repeat protein
MTNRLDFDRRLCLCLDVEGYGGQDAPAQADIQRVLLQLMAAAATAARLDRSHWATQAKGDEVLALLPLGPAEPQLVDEFVRHLDKDLARLNRPRRTDARIRLRLAIHQGVAYRADNGFAGEAVVAVSRLVNAAPVRRALAAAAEADLVVVLSDGVYREVVRPGHTTYRADEFRRVDVQEKEFHGDAWIHLPRADVHRVDLSGAEPSRTAVALGRRGLAAAAVAVSVAPPLGLRDPRRPLRGRDALLSMLQRLLDDGGRRPRVRVLHGLGGCGKTSVALELAAIAKRRGTRVWWVRASNYRAVAVYMQSVARELGASDEELCGGNAADVLWRRLAETTEPWLLIVDNADEPALLSEAAELAEGVGWIRPHDNGNGLVLVTSRDGDPDVWGAWCGMHRVDGLPPEHATEVLLDYATRLAGTRDDAIALAVRLGGLPLALRLAGAYLAETSGVPDAWAPADAIRTFDAYRGALDAGRLDLFTQVDNEPLIALAWEMSLDLLAERGMPHARALLRLLSVLGEAPIPYELVLSPGILAGSPLFAALDGPGLWRVLSAIGALGLAGFNAEGSQAQEDDVLVPRLLRLHPLVRDAGRHYVARSGQYPQYCALAALLLTGAAEAAGSEPEEPITWPRWQTLANHALQLIHAADGEPDVPPETMRRLAAAATLAVRHLFARGLYAPADKEFRFIHGVLQRVVGEHHPDALALRHRRASLLHDTGRYDQAEAELRALIAVRGATVGEEHPDTLVARNELAEVLYDSGQHDIAETEFHAVRDACRRVLGSDHPTTLATRYDLARVLNSRGAHDEAERELRAVLQIRRRLFGDEHIDVIATRGALAYLLHNRGEYITAEVEFRALLKTCCAVLGHDHPRTLGVRNNLARVLHDRGDLDEAGAEFRAVL